MRFLYVTDPTINLLKIPLEEPTYMKMIFYIHISMD